MAAFARYGRVEFAAAYSNAGGLGITTAMSYELTEFKKALNRIQDLTSNPFGVNITINPDGDKEVYL